MIGGIIMKNNEAFQFHEKETLELFRNNVLEKFQNQMLDQQDFLILLLDSQNNRIKQLEEKIDVLIRRNNFAH